MSDPAMTDHAELARLAEAATAGPWMVSDTVVWCEEVVPVPVTVCCGNGLSSGECCGNGVEDCEWERTQGEVANAGSNDAAFIAAANPARVLALLAEIAALRGDVDAARRAANDEAERATQAERQRDEAVGLLRPFGLAADNMDGDEPDGLFIYDSPESTMISYGDLRAVRTFLASMGPKT